MRKKQKDLFGNEIGVRKDKYENILLKFDKNTFQERLKRLQYINKILKRKDVLTNDIESIFIFNEAQMTYINGEYISTILLSQAYIERILNINFINRGYKNEAKRGIKFILDFSKKHKLMNNTIINNISKLVNRRNPFTHLKENSYEFSIINRMIKEKETILKIIEKDAKEAIDLMMTVDFMNTIHVIW